MEALIATAIASSSLAALITWALSRKKDKATIDNLVADTAAKLVEASSQTITDLITRLTRVEENLKSSLKDQELCKKNELELNSRITAVEGREKNLIKELMLVREDNKTLKQRLDES